MCTKETLSGRRHSAMDINPMNVNQGNLYPQAQTAGETAKGSGQGQEDKVELQWKPGGGIACYMYSKLKDQKDVDPKMLMQHKMEAINNAMNNGALTPEAAQKLMAE
jgi:hypothetical protein